jgi:hypothetical protein
VTTQRYVLGHGYGSRCAYEHDVFQRPIFFSRGDVYSHFLTAYRDVPFGIREDVTCPSYHIIIISVTILLLCESSESVIK